MELGGKHNKELATFNLDNLRFNKIVICTDADVDGYQIRTLVLTMLYRLTPTLINKGYVYIAESPLYEITTKDRTYFAYTEPEKAAFLEKIGDKKYTIQRSKGLGENDPEMMWLTTMNPESRRLIKVMPTDVVQTAQVFDILLGDNLAGRKEHIAQHGAEYLDDLDVSLRTLSVIADAMPPLRRRGLAQEGNFAGRPQKLPPRGSWLRSSLRGFSLWRGTVMAKKSTKKTLKPVRPQLGDGVEILNAGSVLEDPITRTLETNYMPYAMSVIVSRALPEIDGFKPAHRKLLYTMYEMGLLKGARTKSANIVGSTMHLNPHGDAAIYDTMVRMGRGNESLLVPFVDSKGNFGKAYSRDMSCAAARYTEAKLESVCEELFRDIDKETVDFVPNYDSTTTEPTLLPVTFPTILANNTLGIAVGMACNICSFNLAELCATTMALMKDEHHDIGTTMPAPDFVGGGQIVYDEAQMREIYENGRGSVKVRARYNAVPGENMIEVTQIPPTTTVEAIMDKIAELVKTGKVKEISDMRDETDLNGLKLTLDLKRGVDADKLMAKLFKATPLEDSFSCNFNILVSGQPRVMGVREILKEWTAFRVECVRRRTYYDLHGKEKRLHLLQGLAAILLDIDKAIRIIRTTEEETEVVPNLMIGFGIDEVQADYVAEIKLRHLNREYILKRTGEIEQLEKDIADLNDVLAKLPASAASSSMN